MDVNSNVVSAFYLIWGVCTFGYTLLTYLTLKELGRYFGRDRTCLEKERESLRKEALWVFGIQACILTTTLVVDSVRGGPSEYLCPHAVMLCITMIALAAVRGVPQEDDDDEAFGYEPLNQEEESKTLHSAIIV